MRLAVDLDGVVFDFVSNLRNYLVDHHGRIEHELPDAETWDFFVDQWGITLDQFLEICAEGVDAGVIFRQGEPLPGARDAINRLRANGHTIHFVTDRRFGAKSPHNTYDWLAEYDIGYDSLSFSHDKTIIDADILIEDRDRNYLAVEAHGKVIPVLMTRPWNLDLVGARRVADWAEFEAFVARQKELASA